MHAPSPEPIRSDIQGYTSSNEHGSLVTEYGLLAVVAATVAGVLIQWATGGAVVSLFNALVDRARVLVGA
jgi:Flp pilus assembly pilin Flp